MSGLGNSIKEKNQKLIEAALNSLLIDGIYGMIAIKGDLMGLCGKIPEIVKANVDYELITKG